MRYIDWEKLEFQITLKALSIAHPTTKEAVHIDRDAPLTLEEFYKRLSSYDRLGTHTAHPGQLVAAAKEILHSVAASFLENVTTWEDIEMACRRMVGGIYLRGLPPEELQDLNYELEASANALKGSADLLYGRGGIKHRSILTTSVDWTDWDYCPFCWRLAPKIKKKQIRRGRCCEHSDVKSAATKRARRLRDYILPEHREERNSSYYTAFKITYRQVKKEAIGFFNISQEVAANEDHHYTYYPIGSFNPSNIPLDRRDFTEDWRVFHRTKQYALDHGADLDDFMSVVKVLDDADDPTGIRNKIHTAFARAPGLAKGMLLMSETWLRLMKQQRTGGSRPGAGRPKGTTHKR